MTVAPIFTLGGYPALEMASAYFFYFIVYSFLGWVLEGTYNLYSQGSFRKEGFLKGPFKPMYGFAPLFLLAARNLPLPLFLLLALLIPSAVEYASGWLLKSMFHKQWWDYSRMPHQLQGHICLRFSLYWWVLSAACIYILHPVMVFLYGLIEPVWELALPLVALLLIVDLLWTCRSRRREAKEPELGGGQLTE